MPKIAAIYIDKTYAIYHSISVLIELSKDKKNDVMILCRVQNFEIINNVLKSFKCYSINVKVLRPYWYIPLPHYFEIKLQLRASFYYKYRRLFNEIDIIIGAMYGDLLFRTKSTKVVYTQHGISNRPYSFDPAIMKFNMFFLTGIDELILRKKKGQLTLTNHALIGYPKYDVTMSTKRIDFFKNKKPTIVYNPHWMPDLTSYFQLGIKVLDFFVENKNYNLIFAPHSLLYSRNKRIKTTLNKYNKCSNILIDLGSERSNNMTYMKSADFFLGDVSSQALEFLLVDSRPCLYLDTHDLIEDKENKFISWQFGKVIDTMDNFEEELEEAFQNHKEDYLQLQKTKISEMFYHGEESASILGARAVMKLLSQ